MSAAASNNHSEDKQTPPDKSTVVLLIGIAADTTWRMFVPIIGATLLGVWADHSIKHIRPVGTIIGIVVGVLIAATLVRQQLQLSARTRSASESNPGNNNDK